MDNPKKYYVFDSVVFRIPTFSSCLSYGEKRLVGNKQEIHNNKIFLEALFLASPDLFSEVEKYNKKLLNGDKLLKFQFSILKYHFRMTSRCTPFGLFAGCGVGKVGEKSEIVPAKSNKFYSSTRLDMDYLCSLIQNISNSEDIKGQIKYYPNSSIYNSGENIRFNEYFYFKTQRKYTLSQAEHCNYLQKVLVDAATGKTIDELAKLLVDEEITYEVAKEFVNSLIDNQLLVGELEPEITGKELLQQLIEKLNKLKGTSEIVSRLIKVNNLIEEIDKYPLGRTVMMYNRISEELGWFNAKFDKKYLFQSDLFIKAEKAIIGKTIVKESIKALSALNQMTERNENTLLKRFKDEFYKKYENEEIPLVQALDVETGIGFGNADSQRGDVAPLLEDIHFNGKLQSMSDIKNSPLQEMLVKKYEKFLSDCSNKEIEITKNDLNDFKENWNDLPDTLSAIVEVIRTEEAPGEMLISMKYAGGSSAANLLGRFCYLNDNIHNFVKEIVQKEKELNPEKILAEIVHLPESRIGNILMRPAFREYEIPYMSNTTVKPTKIIPINDIMVSVQQGKYIRLRSKMFNKEVLPRLTCAHNFSKNSLPIYHFLCAMQTQDLRPGIGFNWGALLENKPFLPRVRYGKTIFSPAMWNISAEDIKEIPDIKNALFFDKVQEFKKNKNLPEKVLWVQGDNKLLIDFNHSLSIQMLFAKIKKRGFRLEEYLFDNTYPLVKRGDTAFTNQVVLCFYKK